MPLVQLIYVSSAVAELTDDELDDILESSIRHNEPQQVTGILLYSGGNFMQVLEGDESAIAETYERICADIRHHNLFLLARQPIAEREFSNWSMGFRRIDNHDAERNPAYAPFFTNGFNAELIAARPGLAVGMLKLFREM